MERILDSQRPSLSPVRPEPVLGLPKWVHACIDRSKAFRLHSATLPAADDLPPSAFQDATCRLYTELLDRVAAHGGHPVRAWNFIPSIHTPGGDDTREDQAGPADRYMVFNAGRFDAFRLHLGDDPRGTGLVPTATAVGHTCRELAVHLLAAPRPGRPVENPRQRPAYRYSPRFGPLPPCFARATLVQGDLFAAQGARAPGSTLLIGGTASVCGEESAHVGDIAAQTRETLLNLASLIRAAHGPATPQSDDLLGWLSRLRDVRVYLRHEVHRALVQSMLASALPSGSLAECLRADICRPELLVEIEGVADGPSRQPARAGAGSDS